MSSVVVFKNTSGKLEGFGAVGRRAWQKFTKIVGDLEVGETLQFSWQMPRSPGHHKFFFGRVQALLDQQETFQTLDHLLIFLKVGAGFVDFMPGPDGVLVAVPKSIAWHRLDEQEFCEVRRAVWDFLWTAPAQAALWPHMDDHQRYAMVDQWFREAR